MQTEITCIIFSRQEQQLIERGVFEANAYTCFMYFNVAVLAWGEGEKKFKHTYSRDCSEFFLYIYTYTRGKIYRYLQLAIIAFIFSSTDTLVIILGQM